LCTHHATMATTITIRTTPAIARTTIFHTIAETGTGTGELFLFPFPFLFSLYFTIL